MDKQIKSQNIKINRFVSVRLVKERIEIMWNDKKSKNIF